MGHNNNQITIKDILSKYDNMYDVSYMFTQPITLRFDGETLQIYENGLVPLGTGLKFMGN